MNKRFLAVAFMFILLMGQVAALIPALAWLGWIGVHWVWTTIIVAGATAATVGVVGYAAPGNWEPTGTLHYVINTENLADARLQWDEDQSNDYQKLDLAYHFDGRYHVWETNDTSREIQHDADRKDEITFTFYKGDVVRDLYKMRFVNWDESSQTSTWKFYRLFRNGDTGAEWEEPVKLPSGAELELTWKGDYSRKRNTIPGVGWIEWVHYDSDATFDRDDITTWDYKLGLEDEVVKSIQGNVENDDQAPPAIGNQEKRANLKIEFLNDKGELLTEKKDGIPVIPREKFTLLISNIPNHKEAGYQDYAGYFGIESKVERKRLKEGRKIDDLMDRALRASGGPTDLTPEAGLKMIDRNKYCKESNPTYWDCEIPISGYAGDPTFQKAPLDKIELTFFTDFGGSAGKIENREIIVQPFYFESPEKLPLSFSVWQTSSFGGDPTQKCSSDTGSPKDKPTCILSPNTPFTLKLEGVAGAGEVYFNAVKESGAVLPGGKNIEAKEGRELAHILWYIYQIAGPPAGRVLPARPLSGTPTVKRNPITVSAPISLNKGSDGITAAGTDSGYYVVNKDCPAFEILRTPATVRACKVDVDRIQGAKAWEGLEDTVGIVVFADNPPGNGKLEKEEIVQYYIKFEAGNKENCTSVKECLADIDKQLAVDPEDKASSKVFDWGAKPAEEPKKED